MTIAVVLALITAGLARDPRADERLSHAVMQELRDRKEFREVRAQVQDGIATLDGMVDRYTDKEQAERVVRDVKDVQGVRNQIEVRPATISDADLRERVTERLRFERVDRGVMFTTLHVAVANGVVTVSGEVPSNIDRAAALAIVADSPGVRDIVDHIDVRPGDPRDDAIRIRAARAIYGDPLLQKYALDPQAPIRILVDHGAVTLEGVVASAVEKRAAEMRAREVPGVFNVDNRLIIAPADGK